MMEALRSSETSLLQEPHLVTSQKMGFLDFYIPEEGSLYSHRRENLKSYIALTGWAL
jgi:hypothetical protein